MFPNREQPNFGIFVLQRLQALSKLCLLKVIAPVPYCPLVGGLKRYAYRAKVPFQDRVGGLEVFYQRFFSIPLIFKPLDAAFLFYSLLPFCRGLQKEFDFDLIDAHLAYPDGFAAVLLGRCLHKPVTVTLRGHDIFALPAHPVRKRQVLYALQKAQRIFSVAQDLKDGAVKLGIAPEKIMVIPNGVDSSRFYPLPTDQARQELNLPLDKKIILSVGHLVVRKGFQHIIRALAQLKEKGREDLLLLIVVAPGIEGDFSHQLKQLIRELQLSAQVKLVGPQAHNRLYLWYNAADVFCLASEQEGCPNVLLEAMACGRPLVASRVGGNPELVSSGECGILVNSHSPVELAEALEKALQTKWNPGEIVARVCEQSWGQVARRIYLENKALVEEKTHAA